MVVVRGEIIFLAHTLFEGAEYEQHATMILWIEAGKHTSVVNSRANMSNMVTFRYTFSAVTRVSSVSQTAARAASIPSSHGKTGALGYGGTRYLRVRCQ